MWVEGLGELPDRHLRGTSGHPLLRASPPQGIPSSNCKAQACSSTAVYLNCVSFTGSCSHLVRRTEWGGAEAARPAQSLPAALLRGPQAVSLPLLVREYKIR